MGVAFSLACIRLISCRIAVASSDLAESMVFLRKTFHCTVVEAVIYCMASLVNGAAAEEQERNYKRNMELFHFEYCQYAVWLLNT